MDKSWSDKFDACIDAERLLHQSYIRSIKVTAVQVNGKIGNQWYALDNAAMADGEVDVDTVIEKTKSVLPRRQRLIGACAIVFDLDHNDILDGVEPNLRTVDLLAGGQVRLPKILPYFHSISEIILFFKTIELIPTRRLKLCSLGRRRLTRRACNHLKAA